MERRHFLLQSAALTLAATGLRCNASQGLTGPSQAVGRKEKHRVAIIGCGRMGQYYADVYRALPDAELVAMPNGTRSGARWSASVSGSRPSSRTCMAS